MIREGIVILIRGCHLRIRIYGAGMKKIVKKMLKIILVSIFHISEDRLKYYRVILRYIVSGKIERREDLPIMLKLRRLNGEGVEVGVALGWFSEYLLKYSNLSKLYSIDPWKEFPKEVYSDGNAVTQQEADERYSRVVQLLSKYKTRSKILRLSSEEAAPLFGPDTFDFIYIDANHKYEACKKDLDLWWPKIKKKGIFAGHDYFNLVLPEGNYFVKKAVDEFADKHKFVMPPL